MVTGRDTPLVVFDLGGVLVRICRSWEEGCARAGVDPDRGWSPTGSGGAHQKLVAAYTVGRIDDAEFFSSLASVSGGVYSAQEFARLHEAWLIGPYPGAGETLTELQGAGLTLACLSNTNAAHWRVLLGYPMLGALRFRHASHLIGRAKPDPEIYAWFSAACAVAPARIVFFDDLPENVAAARAAGWDAVAIDPAGETPAQIRAALRARGLFG